MAKLTRAQQQRKYEAEKLQHIKDVAENNVQRTKPLSVPVVSPDALGGFLALRDRMLRAAGVDPKDFPLDKYPGLINGK